MKKVTILSGGGSSSERAVSLSSGRAVFETLRVQMESELFELEEDCLPESLDSERCVIFPLIHGEFGEDGRLQELLEARGFRYCGSDSVASQICMNKDKAKVIAQRLGILTAEFCFYGGQGFEELEAFAGGPFVVKPNDRGSSVGVSKIYTSADFLYYSKNWQRGNWIIEPCIRGREFTVSILGEEALPVIEICPRGGFYDYAHKYTVGATDYRVPASITAAESRHIQKISKEIFGACGCRDFARLDFILDGDGNFYFLEINTIPGMTVTSLLPKAAAAVGIDFSTLCRRMINFAFERDYSSKLSENSLTISVTSEEIFEAKRDKALSFEIH
ncbi:MAG: D-alanine--D-alanine ligase [Puniceicoccales bacterium]|jgi:D-alanine-D-alanine ligase|nr:D-alanine--D-alanine ligase [Puniceicoccales bacterium]